MDDCVFKVLHTLANQAAASSKHKGELGDFQDSYANL